MDITKTDSRGYALQTQNMYRRENQPKSESEMIPTMEVKAETLVHEMRSGMDLGHITPDETTALAGRLYKEGQIGQRGFIEMMVSAANQLIPPGSVNVPPNNGPYNLVADLESILNGSSTYYPDVPESRKEGVKTLLDVLYSLTPKEEVNVYSAINIKV